MAHARPLDWKNPNYTRVFAERKMRLARVRLTDGWDLLFRYYRQPGNLVHLIEDWFFTYDPRNVNAGREAYVPFLLFPKQQETVRWVEQRYRNREPGLLEKSRDMGATWLMAGVATSLWLLEPGVKISFGSRKESLVDTIGDPDSIIEKIRIILRMLPDEMLPRGYAENQHARYMKIVNPETKSVISGEAGDNIGRGGRSSLYVLDEAAFIERPDSVEAALSQNAECRIDTSTPNGVGNPFYRKRFGGIVSVMTLRWTDDPRKGPEWYAEQCRLLEPKVLAQEVDLDYESSGEDTVIHAAWVRASQFLRKRLEQTPEWPKLVAEWRKLGGVAGFDVGGGSAFSVVVPRFGPLVLDPIDWKDSEESDPAGRAGRAAREAGCTKLKYDSIGVGKHLMTRLRAISRIEVQAVNAGSKPSNRLWPDKKRSTQKFSNIKAEIWWMARERLKAAFEHWMFLEGKGGVEHKLSDLWLLPDSPRLSSQLPLVGYKTLESGKIQIESKLSLERRGIASPDHADALILTLTPPPARSRTGRLAGHY